LREFNKQFYITINNFKMKKREPLTLAECLQDFETNLSNYSAIQVLLVNS